MKYKTAVLIHLLDWQCKRERLALGNGIYLCKLSTHKVGELYIKECKENNMDNGVPYLYKVCLIIHDWDAVAMDLGLFKDPYSIISRLMNVLTIYFQTVIYMARVFISSNNFEGYKSTHEIDYDGAQSEFLSQNTGIIDDTSIKALKNIWKNVRDLWNANQSKSRVINSLTHFYYSWNVYYIEQTAIFASIVLENLFSPHSKDELSHQISFNVCQFLGRDKEDKQKIYKKIKNYYSIRSKIVHGNMANDKEENAIPEFFKIICTLLTKILSDKTIVDIFDNNDRRKKFLEDLIFE